MPPAPLVKVELAHPCRVNGSPVRFQSLWLLLRVYYAHRSDGSSVPVAVLQARFPGKANLRMMVSRAFGDFADWGIKVGWGHERTSRSELLNPMRRSHGPFWMDADSAARLRIRLHGSDADLPELAHFLGLEAALPVHRDGISYAMQDVTYWNNLTQAMRTVQDGFPTLSDANVAGSFRAAQRCAQDEFQSALALLKESLAWRKHGQLKRSQDALKRLSRFLEAAGVAAPMPTFSAMAFVARAWNHYAGGQLVAAHAELDRLAADAELRPVIRYNPRVRFEYLNLQALVHKAIALDTNDLEHAERMQSATRALGALSDALQAAYEADSIDAAQDVAANMGLTLWLCWQNGLIDGARAQSEHAVQTQALRWLGLSEWICDRFGVGGNSAWNTIFVLRIARGCCRTVPGKDLDGFRAQSPLTVEQVIDATRPFHAPFSRAKGYIRWSDVAAFAIEEHDTGRSQYGPLQVANLLLELAWFHAHEKGLCKEAYAAVERLAASMALLQPKERRFFRESLTSLPEPLQLAAREAMKGKAESARERR